MDFESIVAKCILIHYYTNILSICLLPSTVLGSTDTKVIIMINSESLKKETD